MKFFKRLISKFLAQFDSKLPIGISEFDSWAAEIISLSNLPDNDSVRFALATMVLHAGSAESHLPKQYFVDSLIKSAANQVAAQMIQDLKEKQVRAAAEAAKAAEAALKPEVTDSKEVEYPGESTEQQL